MSTMVEAGAIRPQDIFETPNGSVYVAVGGSGPEAAPQARLWCAHPPDAIVFDPPRVDLPAGQTVRLLSGVEAETHRTHTGYVEAAFRTEMDRRHQAMLQGLHNKAQQAAAAERARKEVRRPWWKRLFA